MEHELWKEHSWNIQSRTWNIHLGRQWSAYTVRVRSAKPGRNPSPVKGDGYLSSAQAELNCYMGIC